MVYISRVTHTQTHTDTHRHRRENERLSVKICASATNAERSETPNKDVEYVKSSL